MSNVKDKLKDLRDHMGMEAIQDWSTNLGSAAAAIGSAAYYAKRKDPRALSKSIRNGLIVMSGVDLASSVIPPIIATNKYHEKKIGGKADVGTLTKAVLPRLLPTAAILGAMAIGVKVKTPKINVAFSKMKPLHNLKIDLAKLKKIDGKFQFVTDTHHFPNQDRVFGGKVYDTRKATVDAFTKMLSGDEKGSGVGRKILNGAKLFGGLEVADKVIGLPAMFYTPRMAVENKVKRLEEQKRKS